ncbi:hypothetical protein NKG94_25400 [Micromonospora sp. M12]
MNTSGGTASEQLDEEATDGVQGAGQPAQVVGAGHEAQRDAEHEAEQDLHGEGNLAQAEGHEDVSNCPVRSGQA